MVCSPLENHVTGWSTGPLTLTFITEEACDCVRIQDGEDKGTGTPRNGSEASLEFGAGLLSPRFPPPAVRRMPGLPRGPAGRPFRLEKDFLSAPLRGLLH